MLIIALIVLLLAGSGFFVYRRATAGQGVSLVAARMGRFGLATASPVAVGGALGGQPPAASGFAQAAERVFGRGQYAQRIAAKLERANVKMSASEFIAISIGVLVGAGLIGLVIKGILGLLAGIVIGWFGPRLYLRWAVNRRAKQFQNQLADMAQMMGNSMRAGFSIVQALELVTQEAAQPANEEFERVVTEVKLGLPLDVALHHMLDRMPSEDLGLMVVAINVQRQIGGNLSEILMVISGTVRERVRFQRELKTLTAQGKLSSYIITALPVGLAVVLTLLDRPYESLLYTTLIGKLMIGIALVLLGTGYFLLQKIATIEV